jgi:hypothetical protein
VGLERGPLSLVSITEELTEWKNSGSGSRKTRLTAVEIRCADHATRSLRKSWHRPRRQAAVSRSVQFACRLKATEFSFIIIIIIIIIIITIMSVLQCVGPRPIFLVS